MLLSNVAFAQLPRSVVLAPPRALKQLSLPSQALRSGLRTMKLHASPTPTSLPPLRKNTRSFSVGSKPSNSEAGHKGEIPCIRIPQSELQLKTYGPWVELEETNVHPFLKLPEYKEKAPRGATHLVKLYTDGEAKVASIALRTFIDCTKLQETQMDFTINTLVSDPLVIGTHATLYLADDLDIPMAFRELPVGYAEMLDREDVESDEVNLKAAIHKMQTDRHVIRLESNLTFEEHQELWVLLHKELRETFLNPDPEMRKKFIPRTSGTGGQHMLFHFSLKRGLRSDTSPFGKISRCADLAFEYPAGCSPEAVFERLCKLDDRFYELNPKHEDDEPFRGISVFDGSFM